MIVQHDSDVGHIFVPNQQARLPGGDGGYFVTTNSIGFRSDFEYESRKGCLPRILMFGDSYTAGDNVPNEERFSDILARCLGVEVQNYGVPGTGTDQSLLIWRKFARDVEADLIIICVQIDSFHRIQVSHRPSINRTTGRKHFVPKPYFELDGGELVLRHVPVPKDRPLATEENAQMTRGLREDNWKEFVHRWYIKAPWLGKIRRARTMRGLGDRLVSEFYRLKGVHPYPDIKSPDSPGWRLMEAILRQFIAEVEPLPVIIAPIPTKEFYVNGATPIYQQLFACLDDPDRGVHVADVSNKLVHLPYKMRQRLRFQDGGHFTPLGHEYVANEMAKFIGSRKLIAAPASRSKPIHIPAPRKTDPVHILGISCFYHNSAAAIIRDGEIVAAAEEERFTRVKNDRSFPGNAINYCLEQAGVSQHKLAAVIYYDNASLTLERIWHSLMALDRASAERMWMKIMPSWLRLKLFFPGLVRERLKYTGPIFQDFHHRSHAASCFYPSPFERAAILTVDGVGEWATATIGKGSGSEAHLLKQMLFPHSLGLLYSAFTQFIGFKVNSGEYKMMGLAPYGEPVYVSQILDNVVDLKADGSLELNLRYFSFLHDTKMASEEFGCLFGPARPPESRITRRDVDLARSIQAVAEEAILRMARTAKDLTGEDNLCLAGGVALNCVANGRLLREGPFKDLWIQPAAGDAGCAIGAALDLWHNYFEQPRSLLPDRRSIQGASLLGPQFSEHEIRSFLETFGYPYRYLSGEQRSSVLAESLADGKIVGHFSGRLEFGPRALGSRSILGDPRRPDMQANLNLRIKYRESFRPFAPVVLAEHVGEYFDLDRESPYMLLVAPVRQERRLPADADAGADGDLLRVVRCPRSDIPAVTHVDYSSRVQTIRREDHAAYYDLIRAFRDKTGCAVLINTSFNVRGEPIVCTPQDAYCCFMNTEMDVLALGNFVLMKGDQPCPSQGRGVRMENEPPSRAAVAPDRDRLLGRLKKTFDRSFWPRAEQCKKNDAVLLTLAFEKNPSTWKDVQEPEDLRSVFAIPPEFCTKTLTPAELAASIVSSWRPGATTEGLRPVLTSLIRAALKHSIAVEVDHQVSESVYVMY